MDVDIDNRVKNYSESALAAKCTTIKRETWPKVYVLCSRIHTSSAGLTNASYSFLAGDNFSKWPELCKCKTPATSRKTNSLL